VSLVHVATQLSLDDTVLDGVQLSLAHTWLAMAIKIKKVTGIISFAAIALGASVFHFGIWQTNRAVIAA
jgi:hypothetical protein